MYLLIDQQEIFYLALNKTAIPPNVLKLYSLGDDCVEGVKLKYRYLDNYDLASHLWMSKRKPT